MVKIKFTPALRRFFPLLREEQVEGKTVREVLYNVDKLHPGILGYLLEDNGRLRKHVNIFLQGKLIEDRVSLADALGPEQEVLIFQALSGG